MTEPNRTRSGRRTDSGFEWHALRTLAPYLWAGLATRIRVVVALGLLAAAKIATVYIPVVYGDIVDRLGTAAAPEVVVPTSLILAFGALRVLSIAFAELRDAVFTKVAQRAIRKAALQTFRHLHQLALRYHLERQTGGLSHAIERGTKAIDFILRFMLFNILPTFLEILLVCGILWGLFDIWYALVTLVSIITYVVYTMVVTEWRLKWRREMNATDQRANTRAIDSLLNYETVKYFGNEGYEADRYDQALERYERASVISKMSLSLLNIGQAVIVGIAITVLVLMAAEDVATGAMTIGDFVMVNTYLIQLYLPLNFLGFVYREIKQSLTDMEAMFHLLEIEAEVSDRPGADGLKPGPGMVEFRSVSFGYDARRQILHGVSFQVAPGQTLALVGPSGSGKSTIGRLLFRFYDVADGAIMIDGQDVRDVTQRSLRQAVGVVPQDAVLFNDTIRYNISYGRPDASAAEIEEAARLAAIHDFVMSSPDGYDTVVGERGLKLSGGEKQRVAIARTILKQPRILLFDEATSSLDTHTEREILEALRLVSKEKTTLVIAHRLSTIVDADQILVIGDGRIIEAGRHGELLGRESVYASMWREQQRAARKEAALEASESGPDD